MKSETFECSPELREGLIASTISMLTFEDYKHQKIDTVEGEIVVQVEKKGGFGKLVGLSSALNIMFKQVDDVTLNVEIGAGRWMDKAIVGAISLVALWPLAITAGIGAWRQSKLPGRIFLHITEFLDQKKAS